MDTTSNNTQHSINKIRKSSDSQEKREAVIVFKTNLPEQYRIDSTNLTIPITYTKENLNKLLKKLFEKERKSHENKNFEFYINNQILDTELITFLTNNEKDITSEQVLEIYYFFELSEPELINTVKEDEWIRKIVCLTSEDSLINNNPTKYCVGLFNSEVSFYDPTFKKMMTVNNQTTDITENVMEMLNDILFVKSNSKTFLAIASRSEEENVGIYDINTKSGASKKISFVGKIDNEYINCLSSNPVDLNCFCAGDTTGSLRIYKFLKNNEEVESTKPNKKQKTEVSRLNHVTEINRAHTSEIKLTKWINNMQIITSGDDFSIKVWNTSTNANFCNFNSSYKVATSFASFNNTEGILAGYDDGKIRTWDIRAPNQANNLQFSGHKNKVSEIQVNPLMQQMFVSTGFDKMVKVWDLRSKKPLYEIKCEEGEKNFGLAFNSGKYFMVGGDNSAVRIYDTGI